MENEPKIIFIHIGKCCGSVVYFNLKKRNIKFINVHHANFKRDNKSPYPLSYIPEDRNYIFLATIRHPIDRWVSAFNFKYTRVVVNNENDKWEGEREGYIKWENANNLAESLYNEEGELNDEAVNFALNGSDHMKFGIHHYLRLLKRSHKLYFIRHENVREDYEGFFGVDFIYPNYNLQPNFKQNDIISLKAYNNLKRLLINEYKIIEKLWKWGKIDDSYKDFCFGMPKSTTIVDENGLRLNNKDIEK